MKISSNIQTVMERFHSLLDVQKNFDIVYHTMEIGGKQACLYFIDGFTKDEVLLKLMQTFSTIKDSDMPSNAHDFSKKYVAYGETGLETDEAAVWISEPPAVLCRFRRYEANALFYLLRVAAVSKEDRLHTGGNGLLRNIASVLEIDLHHQAHPMQLSCTRHILKVALGKRRVLADKLHIVIVARAAGRLDHNRPGTPDARGKRWLARLEEHPQMIGFVCHSLVLKSSAAAAFLQLSGAPDGSSPSAPASQVRWAGTFSDP